MVTTIQWLGIFLAAATIYLVLEGIMFGIEYLYDSVKEK